MSRQAMARFHKDLRHRINAGREAVRGQMAFFGRQFGQVASEWKVDDTRVTFADFAISENLFAALRRDFPKDDYCSEEASPQDEDMVLGADFAWIIDPIDGTNNFALGFPICAISLALLHKGAPVYGFIYDYSTTSLYEGGAGQGLFRNQKKLNRDATSAEAQTMIGAHFPMEADLQARLSKLMAKYRVRSFGSAALSATYVASGYLTGAIDYRVKVWDIAAAYALCAAVGMEWRFVEGSPFPAKSFHPHQGSCPYYVGTKALLGEIEEALVKA